MPRTTPHQIEAVLFLFDEVWRSSEYEYMSGLPGTPGGVAGIAPGYYGIALSARFSLAAGYCGTGMLEWLPTQIASAQPFIGS